MASTLLLALAFAAASAAASASSTSSFSISSLLDPTTSTRNCRAPLLGRAFVALQLRGIGTSSSVALELRGGGGFDRFLDRLYEKADVDSDGKVTLTEAWEMVLKMYVKINQQAPVPPPTRQVFRLLFDDADVDGSGQLEKDEFKKLAATMAGRASARIVTHKLVTLFCAPLLALKAFAFLSGRTRPKEWGEQALKMVGLGDKTGQVWVLMHSSNFWRTAVTVGCVATLGNITIMIVNAFLNADIVGKAKAEGRGRCKGNTERK